mgnify:CR=1 FL=1
MSTTETMPVYEPALNGDPNRRRLGQVVGLMEPGLWEKIGQRQRTTMETFAVATVVQGISERLAASRDGWLVDWSSLTVERRSAGSVEPDGIMFVALVVTVEVSRAE